MPARAARRSRVVETLEALKNVRLTHPERVLYEEQGITKLDLARYYVEIAPWILPHVENRPLSIVRCPAGTSGECFFQRHPPTGLADDVERIRVREKSGSGTYLVIHDIRGVIALVQFGALELHAWGCRADDVERPDRMIFDLDPGPGVKWSEVVEGAKTVRALLADRGLKSFVKLSGGKGVHVVVPLDATAKWPEVKAFARSAAAQLAKESPGRFVDVMAKSARMGKIFVDYLRNERGATTVAAYSTRARRGAPVSLPVSWAQLSRTGSGDEFSLGDVSRVVAKRIDPWREIGQTAQSLDET